MKDSGDEGEVFRGPFFVRLLCLVRKGSRTSGRSLGQFRDVTE